ncbi:MAG TPA: alpha/beta hydrolase [Thermoleophilaceae bacterium]|jgi:pimeloyl-ACP methyl ester carboxylesterase
MTYDDYKSSTRTTTTPHGEFAYLDAGEGPPALFVHGLFMSGYFWAPVIGAVKDVRRCIAYNLPDHGGTTVAAEQDLSLDANAEMLEAFCDSLGLDRFDLVANDTGGAIAQALAVRIPDRVKTLTLTNCEARDWMPSKHDLGQLVKSLAEQGQLAQVLAANYEDRDAARSTAFAATFQWPDRPSDDDVRGLMEPHQTTLDAAKRLERFAAAIEPNELMAIEPRLRELTVPSLAVWGTGDPIFPLELAHWLRDTIPSLDEVVEIEGGLLFWPWERPDELAPHLRRHWT